MLFFFLVLFCFVLLFICMRVQEGADEAVRKASSLFADLA